MVSRTFVYQIVTSPRHSTKESLNHAVVSFEMDKWLFPFPPHLLCHVIDANIFPPYLSFLCTLSILSICLDPVICLII